MKKVRTGIICGVIAAAVVLIAGVVLTLNQPIVRVANGGLALDESLSLAEAERLIVDEANVLSEKTEQIAAIYNANWKEMAGRVMAVVTVNDAGQAEETAWKWFELLSLGVDDALLLVETRNGGSCTVVAQGAFRADFDGQPSGFMSSLTYHTMKNRDFDTAVQNVFTRVHLFHNDYHESVAQSGMKLGIVIAVVLAVVLVFVIVQRIFDRRRANIQQENVEPRHGSRREISAYGRKSSINDSLDKNRDVRGRYSANARSGGSNGNGSVL